MIKSFFRYFEGLVAFREHELILPDKAGSFHVLFLFLRPFKWVILLSAIAGAALTLLELFKFWGIAYIVDAVATSADQGLTGSSVLLLFVLVGLYFVLDPLIWLVNYALRMQSLRSQTKASSLWQSHKAASRHDLAYFNATHAGQVAGRIGQLSTAVQAGAELLAGRFPMGFVRFLGSAILVSYLVPIFLPPVMIWIIMNGLFAVWLAPKVNAQAQKISETSSVVNGAVTEYFSNIRAIKTAFAYGSEDAFVFEKIDRQNANNLHINRLTTITGFSIRVLNTGLVAAVLGLGVYALSIRAISPGDFVAGVTLSAGMAADAGWFVAIWEGLTQTLGTIRDAQPTITAKPTVVSGNTTDAFMGKPSVVEFANASFSYGNGVSILRNVSLEIKPGEKVGIIGPSGAGKSTLIDILLRHYDVTEGAILFDGRNVKDLDIQELRELFAVVSQSDKLFHRSVRDNIAFGVASYSEDEFMRAVDLANAREFIEEFPEHEGRASFDTLVGDRGAKLSGGQQQRVLLARAFMQKRPILLLDEATSALDSNSENLIQEAIRSLPQGTTVVAVAHRLSTVKDFDKIVVLNGGEVSGVGTHKDLIENNLLYADLWRKQTGV